MSSATAGTVQGQAAGGYFGILRRRWIFPATILPAILFVCVFAAFAIRPEYQGTATIMLEPSSVPKDIIESTVMSYSDQEIQIVQGRVMTAETLQKIVRAIDPYPGDKKLTTVADKAQKLLEDTSLEKVDPVTFKPQAESNTFSLHYNNPNPDIALKIDGELAQLFLTYNQIRRTEAAGEAVGFLAKQAEQVQQQMREVDAQLAVLKSKYGEALPEFMQRNQGTLEDTQRQLDSVQQQVLTAQEKESVLAVQLSQMSPNLITQSGDLTDIATVRAKLAEAEQRYTPDHPEVRRLKKALETLMAQNNGTPDGAVNAASNNPQYQLTAAQLKAARDELANLKLQAAQLRAKLDQYRTLVSRTPAAEKEISEVLRRREVLQNEYQHTQDRLQSANLAETFESKQGGERFTMLREPAVPRAPVFPNRVGLVLIGLVVGLALTGIAVALAESSDRRLRIDRDLPLLGDVPLLASVPVIKNTRDRRRRALVFTTFAAGYSLAAAVLIAVVLSASHR